MLGRLRSLFSRQHHASGTQLAQKPSVTKNVPLVHALEAKEEDSSSTAPKTIAQKQLDPINRENLNKLLFEAVRDDKLDSLELNRLILSGADVNACIEEGIPVLIWALMRNRNASAKVLIKAQGVNLDLQDSNGFTALFHATSVEIVKLLIKKNAKLNIQNTFGNTALIDALRSGYNDKAQTLIDAKANVDEHNTSGLTALIEAVNSRNIDIVNKLIIAKANLDWQDNDGWTALHLAVYMGYIDIVQTLTDAGANLYLQDSKGLTPLKLASQYKLEEIEKLLKAKMDENTKMDENRKLAFLLGLHARVGAQSSVRRAWTAELSKNTSLLPVIFEFAASAEQIEDEKT